MEPHKGLDDELLIASMSKEKLRQIGKKCGHVISEENITITTENLQTLERTPGRVEGWKRLQRTCSELGLFGSPSRR